MNLIKGLYYNQTPNNSIYNKSKFYKNSKRYNKFQQNYSQSLYSKLNKNKNSTKNKSECLEYSHIDKKKNKIAYRLDIAIDNYDL